MPLRRDAGGASVPSRRAARAVRLRWRLCLARRHRVRAALQRLRSRRRSVAKRGKLLLLHVSAAAMWRRLCEEGGSLRHALMCTQRKQVRAVS